MRRPLVVALFALVSSGACSGPEEPHARAVPSPAPAEQAKIVLVSEQIIREYLGERVSLQLEGLQSLEFGVKIGLIAEITGARRLRSSEIADLRRGRHLPGGPPRPA